MSASISPRLSWAAFKPRWRAGCKPSATYPRLSDARPPVGQAILPVVRKFVLQMEQLELAVREATAGQTGMLTIGAISSAMLDVLPPFLERLRK